MTQLLRARRKLWLLPACAICNAYLSNRKLLSVRERRAFLYIKLGELVRPMFSESELRQFGPGIHDYIRKRNYKNKLLIECLHGVEALMFNMEDWFNNEP
jgi:hypothetical protein